MKNELNMLDNLIRALVGNVLSSGPQNFLKTIHEECLNVKERLLKEVFSNESENMVERYIQYHQGELIGYADEVSGAIAFGSENISVLKAVLVELQTLLSFIERHFTRFFNLDYKVPDVYLNLYYKEVSLGFKELMRALKKKKIDERILGTLNDFLESKGMVTENEVITFKRLIFYKELLRELWKIAESNRLVDYNKKLATTLCYLNFNTFQAYGFCKSVIDKEVKSLSGKETQLDKLALFSAHLEGTKIKPGFSLQWEFPALTTALMGWIETEKKYVASRRSRKARADQDTQYMKVGVGVSVPQLALFIRIMEEQGVLFSETVKQLLLFMATFCRTRNAENISYDNLYNSYYTVEESTIQAVKRHVIGMLNILNAPLKRKKK